MMHLILAALARGGERITLSGESIASTGAADQTASVVIRTDGTVDSVTTQAGTNQIDAATDWIIPNGLASSSYEFRYTNLVGTALTSAPGAEDAWVALSADQTFSLTDSDGSAPTATFDIEVRKGSGATLASGSYTLSPVKF